MPRIQNKTRPLKNFSHQFCQSDMQQNINSFTNSNIRPSQINAVKKGSAKLNKESTKSRTQSKQKASKTKEQLWGGLALLEQNKYKNQNFPMYYVSSSKQSRGNSQSQTKASTSNSNTKRISSAAKDRKSQAKINNSNKKMKQYESIKFGEVSAKRPTPYHQESQRTDQILINKKQEEISHAEDSRLSNLKKYLQVQSKQFLELHQKSNKHILSQMTQSKQNLIKSFELAKKQSQFLNTSYKKDIESLHAHYNQFISKQAQDILLLTSKLKDQTNLRVKSDIKLRESQVMIKCIKEKLLQTQQQKNKIQLEMNKIRREKDFIRKEAYQALAIVQNQLSEQYQQVYY